MHWEKLVNKQVRVKRPINFFIMFECRGTSLYSTDGSLPSIVVKIVHDQEMCTTLPNYIVSYGTT